MGKRVIRILGPGGGVLREIDISDLDNADTQCPLALEVATLCDQGEWHSKGWTALPLWGNRLRDPVRPFCGTKRCRGHYHYWETCS